MKQFLLIISSLVVFAFTVECAQVLVPRGDRTDTTIDYDEPMYGQADDTVERRGSPSRHPYLQEDLYTEIASLDLTAKPGTRRTAERPSISVIKANTSRCVADGGIIRLEFQVSVESLERDLTYSQLVVELEDSDDAVSLLSSYVLGPALPGKERDRVPVTGHPKLRNKWLVYDVSEILRVLGPADQRSGTVTLAVQLIGASTWNGTGSKVKVDSCGRFSRSPPTVFLYHDFPGELRERLQESASRRPVRRSASSQRSDQTTACHLHQWTVDFHQMGMKWVIAPVLFKVNYCHGVCSDPAWNQTDLRVHQLNGRVSNHALMIIRALANLPQAETVGLPSPSCVPTGYDPMNMIYVDRSNIVRVETFSMMIASSCGCA